MVKLAHLWFTSPLLSLNYESLYQYWFILFALFYFVIMSVWCFVSQRKHLLMILLSLEMIVLSMFFMLNFEIEGILQSIFLDFHF